MNRRLPAGRPLRYDWRLRHSGYIQDLDGYYWEIAYWEGWKFDANDMLIIDK